MDKTILTATPSRNEDFASAGPVNLKTNDGILVGSCLNPDNGRDNAADAREIARRWNAHVDLVRHLDNLLCQLEDTGRATIDDVEAAREMLVRHGYNDKALAQLIDENP